MKRLSLFVFVAFAACLLVAPLALAATKSHSPVRVRHSAAAPRSYARLGVDPAYDITGHVLDFNGNPVTGAGTDWGWWDSNTGFNWGGTNMPDPTSTGTAADGMFHFAGVGGHPGNDFLDIYDCNAALPNAGGSDLLEMLSWSLDFSTSNDATLPSGFSYEMQPGEVNLTFAHAPGELPVVKVGDADTPGYALTGMWLNAGSGVAAVLPPQFNDVVASYPGAWRTLAAVEALEPAPVAVAGGATATDTVALDWNNAQHACIAGPLCRHSGKPGVTVKMTLTGWPAGETADLSAFYGTGSVDYKPQLSAGPTFTYVVPLKVAARAPVGPYQISTWNSAPASFLALSDIYQVCTFKPSLSSIRRGGAVRLSGKVWGGGTVTIYSTTHKVSAQPSTLAAKGWHRVGAYKTKSSKFITGLLRPSRTTWYVAKYTHAAFPAFTSVIRVTVR